MCRVRVLVSVCAAGVTCVHQRSCVCRCQHMRQPAHACRRVGTGRHVCVPVRVHWVSSACRYAWIMCRVCVGVGVCTGWAHVSGTRVCQCVCTKCPVCAGVSMCTGYHACAGIRVCTGCHVCAGVCTWGVTCVQVSVHGLSRVCRCLCMGCHACEGCAGTRVHRSGVHVCACRAGGVCMHLCTWAMRMGLLCTRGGTHTSAHACARGCRAWK